MNPATQRIAALNDLLRTTLLSGSVVFTPAIKALDPDQRARIAEAVQGFDAFTADNDPRGEHDAGAVHVDGIGQVLWTIDYYDPRVRRRSEDPADPAKTHRVLAIMLAAEC